MDDGPSDVLHLDGQRLLPGKRNGSGCPEEYHTEISAFDIVKPFGLQCSGYETEPISDYTSLYLLTKNGRKVWYGNTPNSRLLNNINSKPVAYLMNRVEDEAGNYIDYNYAPSLQTRIRTIQYTGNLNSGMSPYNYVEFIYQLRNDKNTIHIGNRTETSEFLLKEILVVSDWRTVRKYVLEYGENGSYSFLKSVQLFGLDANTALNKTSFLYGNESSEIVTIYNNSPTSTDYTVADINGDGFMDVVSPINQSGSQLCTEYNVGFSLLNGNSAALNFSSYPNTNLQQSEFLSAVQVGGPGTSIPPIGTKGSNSITSRYLTTDFNSDGLDDLFRLNTETFLYNNTCNHITTKNILKDVTILLSTGNGLFNTVTYNIPNPNLYYFKPHSYHPTVLGDFDGDLAPELLILVKKIAGKSIDNGDNKIFYYNHKISGLSEIGYTTLNDIEDFHNATTIGVGDYDGDGNSEVYLLVGESIVVYDFISDGYSLTTKKVMTFPIPHWINRVSNKVWFGDYNGDGLADIIECSFNATEPIGGFRITYGTGYGFTPWQRCDFLGSSVNLYYNTSRSQPNGTTTSDWFLTGDFNGDGMTDVAREERYIDNSNTLKSKIEVFYSKGYNRWKNESINFNFYFPDQRGVVVADMNADGRDDIITTNMIISLKPSITDCKLLRVREGNGKMSEFNYVSSPRNSPTSNSHTVYGINLITKTIPVIVVNETIENIGLPGILPISTTFSYGDQVLHRTGKGFLGFQSLTSFNASTNRKRVTTNLYNTSISTPANIYPPLGSRIFVANTTNETSTVSPATLLRTTINTNAYSATGYMGIYTMDSTEVLSTDNLSGVASYAVSRYSLHGNIYSSSSNVGNGLHTTNQEDWYSTSIVPGFNPYPRNLTSTTLTNKRVGVPAESSTTLMSYNSNGQLSIITRRPYTSNTVNDIFTYNQLGNLISKQEVVFYNNNLSQTNSFTYDSKGRFLLTKTNPLGFMVEFTYLAPFGVTMTSKGVDRLTVSHSYDEFGRLTSTTEPNAAKQTSINRTWATGGNALSKVTTTSNMGEMVFTENDGLGRPLIESKLQSLSPGIVNFTTVETSYDILGNVMSTTQPHLPNETNYLTTTYIYDWLNRPIQSCNILGCNGTGYSYANGNFLITNTNPAGQITGMEQDATGLSIRTWDASGEVFHKFDSWGNEINTGLLGFSSNDILVSEYDSHGRKIKTTDKNAGVYLYEYDELDRTTKETNPQGQATTYTYDLIDRMMTRTGAEGITTYHYFNCNAIGQGLGMSGVTDFHGNTETNTLDNLGRLSTHTKTVNGTPYLYNYVYDNYDRLASTTYPTGLVLDYQYQPTGEWSGVYSGNNLLYQALAWDGKGAITNALRGDGHQTSKNYYRGYFTSAQSPVQEYHISWNHQSDNVTHREDRNTLVYDYFSYDNLNRLEETITFQNNLPSVVNQTYNTLGNIANKTDVGNYQYAQKPNGVSYIDNNANNIPIHTQDVTFNSFQQPELITENGYALTLMYDHTYNRVQTELQLNGQQIVKKTFLTDGYEIHEAPSNLEEIIYVPGPDGICAINYTGAPDGQQAPSQWYFPYSDHLESINSLTDVNGQVVHNQSFDTWGQYRDPITGAVGQGWINNFPWLRGYTGHEHLPEFGLINMNGRLYDPMLGRMLSPDIDIPDPNSVQGYNRFSYAKNNPLKYGDPSGQLVWFVPVIYAAANVAVDLVRSNGNMNFGEIATSAITGAIGGLLGGGAITTPGGAIAGAAISQFNRVIPSIPLYQSENVNFSFSPSFGMGTSGPTFGASFNASGKSSSGEFVWSVSVSGGYNSGMSSLGEAAGSSNYASIGAFAGYSKGGTTYGAGVGSQWFTGAPEQKVGFYQFQFGDFNLRIDEDLGKLGDGEDRYRTGGLFASYKVNEELSIAVGASMITGDADNKNLLPGGNPKLEKGTYNSCGEIGFNLRGGIMYGGIIYKGQSFLIGHNSEKRLHTVQNAIHRSKYILSPYFEDRMFKSKMYSYYGGHHSNYLYY